MLYFSEYYDHYQRLLKKTSFDDILLVGTEIDEQSWDSWVK